MKKLLSFLPQISSDTDAAGIRFRGRFLHLLYVVWALSFELIRGEEIGVANSLVAVASGFLVSRGLVDLVYKGKVNMGGAVYFSDDEHFPEARVGIVVIVVICVALWPLMYISN